MSNRPRLVLHVGYPKAGSSSLQETLCKSQADLHRYGVIYPSLFISPGTFKHEELFRLVRLGQMHKVSKLLRDLTAKYKNYQTVVLSTESIVNQLNNIEDYAWRDFFNALKSLFVLELVIVRRPAEGFKRSYYKQAVINQPSGLVSYYGTSLTLADFCELDVIKQLSDSEAIIGKLSKLSNATVRVFDYSSEIVRDFAYWLTGDQMQINEAPASNVSLKDEEVELIRQINNVVFSSDDRNAWLSVLSDCSQLASNTARALAGRAKTKDIMALDIRTLDEVECGLNPSLGANDVRLKDLASKMKCRLIKIHADYKENINTLPGTGMELKEVKSSALDHCVSKKLSNIVNSKVNISLGEKLHADGQLELAPFKAVSFKGWGAWEQDPLNNRSWQWRLNWLSFIPYLLAYHYSVKNDDILDFACDGVQSWLDEYLSTDQAYPFEFVWHDHATALRTEQLILIYYYCKKFAQEWLNRNKQFQDYIEQALHIHGQWLVKDSFYSEHTNHGLEQARVLLLLGTVCTGVEANEWRKIAVSRISSELAFAFTDEGVHVENSPAYHIFVFKVFIGIIKDYPANLLGNLAKEFDKFSVKALSFITHILRPDALLPPIGDTEQLPTSDAYKELFGESNEYQHFLYALTKGEKGIRPDKLNVVYPQSGYAIFRNRWPDQTGFLNAFHITVKAGCSSRYHHQQDEGHISVYAGGEDWLIDSGLYNYINKDPMRRYMRSRQAHNVPIISDTSYAKEFEHRLRAWKVLDYDEAPSAPFVNMQLNMLEQVKHNRVISFDAENTFLEVQDNIESKDHKKHNILLQWHIPVNKNVAIGENKVEVRSASGSALSVEFVGDVPDSISIAKGKKENKILSYVSYKANRAEPSQVLRVLFKERVTLSVNTHFTFRFV
ncbi:heparinase II/III family protein [Halomonas sp. HP20-15]|uniref:heparinase II/III domain-containing protein n=1 Tax=Halomonas sp. HP20-15 TaxID=3085901 RepID=UPI00298299C9|nr:heparinase II/III family protein [Halomonas sp. HP20-15]MDW5378857.1 heparinase II/III family protein [Halomonas sp. HP20-15]